MLSLNFIYKENKITLIYKMNQDILYTYPESSCDCWNCNKNQPQPPKIPRHITKSAMSYGDNYYNCKNNYVFKNDIEPNCQKGKMKLNLSNQERWAPRFDPVVCGCKDGCPHVTYASRDPRLRNGMRGDLLRLDRPPSDSTIKLKDMYGCNLQGYGTNYKDYSDITAGDITYYIDKSVEEGTFYEPVFSTQEHSIGEIYKDPMDNMEYRYNRYPLHPSNPITKKGCKNDYTCLSFTDNTSKHREDMMTSWFRTRDKNSRTRR